MNRLCKLAAVVGMAVLLVVTSVVTACGGGEKETYTVTLGWLGDQTGAASGGFKEVMWGMEDYLAEMDPIPGVKIEFEIYDTRLDYGRIPLGYEYLEGKGMDMCLIYAVGMVLGITGDFAQDQIPAISMTVDPNTRTTPWMYGYAPDYNYEGEYLIEYLVKDWWEAKGMSRPIKIGVLSQPSSATTNAFWEGFDAGLAANPGKCELTKVTAAITQTAFVSEVTALKDTDVVIITMPGTPGPLFMKEALQREYKGRFVSSSASLLGVWSLTKSLLTPQQLDGLIVPHNWHIMQDDDSFTTNMVAALEKRRPSDAASLKQGTTWQTGWTLSHIIANIVRLAVDNVGADKVDGAAINDAINEMSIEDMGMPAVGLSESGGQHILQRYYRMIEYRATDQDWHAISDWFTVVS